MLPKAVVLCFCILPFPSSISSLSAFRATVTPTGGDENLRVAHSCPAAGCSLAKGWEAAPSWIFLLFPAASSRQPSVSMQLLGVGGG